MAGYEIWQREPGVGEKVIVALIANAIVPGINMVDSSSTAPWHRNY